MAQTHKINIQNMKFDPASVSITKGDTVEWTNRMGMAHTVTGDYRAQLGDSGNIAPNGERIAMFSTPPVRSPTIARSTPS